MMPTSSWQRIWALPECRAISAHSARSEGEPNEASGAVLRHRWSRSVRAGGGAPLGAGSGHIHFGSNREFITFSAVQHSDGTVTGTATVHDVSAGVTAQIGVNCLNVIANTATISGIVTRSTDPALQGFEGIFQVVDGGEGKGSADLMSLANFFAVETGADCKVPES
jgi:hypothetical protein